LKDGAHWEASALAGEADELEAWLL
jgi:hypothetical protein